MTQEMEVCGGLRQAHHAAHGPLAVVICTASLLYGRVAPTSIDIHSVCIHSDTSAHRLIVSEGSRRILRPCMMWNDEDNNPYGTSFERRDSTASSSANPNSPGSRELPLYIAFAGLQNDGIDLFR